jgi:hypothetical protein
MAGLLLAELGVLLRTELGVLLRPLMGGVLIGEGREVMGEAFSTLELDLALKGLGD